MTHILQHQKQINVLIEDIFLRTAYYFSFKCYIAYVLINGKYFSRITLNNKAILQKIFI